MEIRRLNKLLNEKLHSISKKDIKKALQRNSENAKQTLKHPDKIGKYLKEFQEKVSNISEYNKFIPSLVNMVNDYCVGQYKDISFGTMVGIVSCILYFIFPMDLLPDKTPVVGYIDDIAILKYTIDVVKLDIEKYEKWKKSNK